VLEFSPPTRAVHRRIRRDPVARYKPDISKQLDAIRGCPDAHLPADHVARKVEAIVRRLDLSSIEKKDSSLGRHGFHPRNVLSVWVYASWCQVHHSTKVAQLLKTDLAYRYLSGGYAISAGKLRRFRRENGPLFESAIQQTVNVAAQAKLLPLDELSTDSVRLEAHASVGKVRTLSRSTKRIEELEAQSIEGMTPEEQERRLEKLEKHRSAVAKCESEEKPNYVVTNPAAALMKFPNGAAMPGHRVTVTAAGSSLRLVVSLLIDAAGNDFGKLGPAVEKARAALTTAGVPSDAKLRLCADGGYTSEEDLLFALANRKTVEILLAEGPLRGHRNTNGTKFFTRDDFSVAPDGVASCPAGTRMHGPMSDGPERIRYNGVGCENCPLRLKCTDKKTRSLTVRPKLDEARNQMLATMETPAAAQAYRRRCCTIEPVFAGLQDQMGFRRISTRHPGAARAEILMKILAYNLSRLSKSKRLRRVFIIISKTFDPQLRAAA
jgi:transposase